MSELPYNGTLSKEAKHRKHPCSDSLVAKQAVSASKIVNLVCFTGNKCTKETHPPCPYKWNYFKLEEKLSKYLHIVYTETVPPVYEHLNEPFWP